MLLYKPYYNMISGISHKAIKWRVVGTTTMRSPTLLSKNFPNIDKML